MKNNFLPIVGIVAILIIVSFVVFTEPTAPISTENPPIDDVPGFNFVFKYGVGAKNELNTFERTYTKDMVTDPSITIGLTLSNTELTRIYEKIRDLELLERGPEPNSGDVFITPCSSYYLKVQNDDAQKEFSWNNCHGEPDERLEEFTNYIVPIIQSKEEYKALPRPQGGYM